MDQPSNMTVQQWLEFIRHAKDDQEIAAFADRAGNRVCIVAWPDGLTERLSSNFE